MDRYFWNLTGPQIDGLACVLCGVDYLRERIPSVPVGIAAESRVAVFACADPCAGRIAEQADLMARQIRAAAEEAGSDREAEDVDTDDDGFLGGDGHFGSLLRDLRALVGTEALLAVSDDLATIKFLLSLTAHHADEAKRRATVLLGRLDGGEG